MTHEASEPTHSASTHETALAMASLCVAVLFGAWGLRPNPPPRGPDLTQLSVLRQ